MVGGESRGTFTQNSTRENVKTWIVSLETVCACVCVSVCMCVCVCVCVCVMVVIVSLELI